MTTDLDCAPSTALRRSNTGRNSYHIVSHLAFSSEPIWKISAHGSGYNLPRTAADRASNRAVDNGPRTRALGGALAASRLRLLPTGPRRTGRAPGLPLAQPRRLSRPWLRHRRDGDDRDEPLVLGSTEVR